MTGEVVVVRATILTGAIVKANAMSERAPDVRHVPMRLVPEVAWNDVVAAAISLDGAVFDENTRSMADTDVSHSPDPDTRGASDHELAAGKLDASSKAMTKTIEAAQERARAARLAAIHRIQDAMLPAAQALAGLPEALTVRVRRRAITIFGHEVSLFWGIDGARSACEITVPDSAGASVLFEVAEVARAVSETILCEVRTLSDTLIRELEQEVAEYDAILAGGAP